MPASTEKCAFFANSGNCKFGANCKFIHDRGEALQGPTQILRIGPHGLPLRPEANKCTVYRETGQCRYGESCKYDHPITFGQQFPLGSTGQHFGMQAPYQPPAIFIQTNIPFPSSGVNNNQNISVQQSPEVQQRPMKHNKPKGQPVSSRECCVCSEPMCSTFAFVPCGHSCCCERCLQKQKLCPLCRTKVESTVKVFLA